MLECIITSKTKRDILTLFFLNPENEFYIREVCRRIIQEPNLVRKELKKFEKIGLLKMRKKGNSMYYSVNKQNIIYYEIKGLITKLGAYEDIMKKELKKYDEVKIAFVYGSFARGEERSNSDIDLMVVGNPDLNKFNKGIKKIENIFHRDINYSIYPKEEFIKKLGTGFLTHILKNKKIMVIGDENELEQLIKGK